MAVPKKRRSSRLKSVHRFFSYMKKKRSVVKVRKFCISCKKNVFKCCSLSGKCMLV